MQRLLAAAVTALVLPTLAACSTAPTTVPGAGDGPDRVTVAYDAGTAQVAAGEVLTVDFGQINRSVGDGWFLVTAPDPAVLSDNGADDDSECEQPGCGSHLTWSFTPVAAGTTAVAFRYCYRTQLAHCEPRPGEPVTVPVPLKITVTP